VRCDDAYLKQCINERMFLHCFLAALNRIKSCSGGFLLANACMPMGPALLYPVRAYRGVFGN